MENLSINTSNRERVLSEIINLRGWYKDFATGRRQTDLHVDVAFAEGEFTTEDDIPISFVARVKKVRLVVRIPETENAEFVAGSEAITVPNPVRIKKKKGTKKQGKIGSKGGEVKGTNAEDEGYSTTSNAISNKFWLRDERCYEWHLSPTVGDILDDRPWNPNKKKLVKIKDKRANVNDGMQPVVRVSVCCHVKDFDIEFVQKPGFLKLAPFPNTNAEKAALQHIKNCLVKSGLETNHDMGVPHGEIVLGDISAEARS